MIRLNIAFRKRQDLSTAEFQRVWRERHGPLVAGLQQDLQIYRYVQSHTDHEDPVGLRIRAGRETLEEQYDGLDTYWFESMDTLQNALAANPEAERAIIGSEASFSDHGRSAIWVGGEYGMINTSTDLVARPGGPYVKLVALFDPRPGMELEAFYRHWTCQHGSLARRQAALAGMHQYFQNPTFKDPLNDRLQAARGCAAPYHAYSECWYHRTQFLLEAASPASPMIRNGSAFLEDEARFIDASRLSFWVTREHVIIAGYLG